MRQILVVLTVVLLCLAAFAAAAEGARFEAAASVDFQLRGQPRDNARRMKRVNRGSKVQVQEVGEEWSSVTVEGRAGYAKTAWLSRFRAHNPMDDQVPGMLHQAGVVQVNKAVMVSVPGYDGNMLSPGDVVAVNQFDGGLARVHMMRDTATLSAEGLTFTPFVPWQQAHPGDMLYAFTTFYNDSSGGLLAGNRANNIELAAQRLDGAVLAPGEALSFNSLCGPYTKGQGYLLGPNIGGDGKGYGGGVCQVSTTLYNAALGLPLHMDQWKVHRERGVDYIPQYFDASVGLYGDLAFSSLLPYALRVQVLPQNGALTVLLFRANAAK